MRNFTDIDDKILRRAQETGVDWKEVAERYITSFQEDMKALGVPPVDFLVLPRVLALMLMVPLLCIYSDLMGVLGGMIVGVGMLDLGIIEYYNQTLKAIKLTYFWIGLFHSFVFGILVALAGCLRGLQCERNASAVGFAATSAVVTGIVSIVVATAIITLTCQVLGI